MSNEESPNYSSGLNFTAQNVFPKEKEENVTENDIFKSLNDSVFDTLENDLLSIPSDLFEDVKPFNNSLICNSQANTLTSHNDLDFFSSPFEVADPQGSNMGPLLSDSRGGEEFDLDMLLSSPIKTADSSNNASSNDTFDNPKYDSDFISHTEVCETPDKESLEKVIPTCLTRVQSEETIPLRRAKGYDKSQSLKRKHKQKQHSLNSMISFRKVKYAAVEENNKSSTSTNTQNTETICFATHPALKTYGKKSYSKKLVYRASKNMKSPQKMKEAEESQKVYPSKQSPSKERNINMGSSVVVNAMVLPVGDTGCSISIPTWTYVDIINSLTPQPFSDAQKVSKHSLIAPKISNLNSTQINTPQQNQVVSKPIHSSVKSFNQVYPGFDIKTGTESRSHLKNRAKKPFKIGNNMINLKNIVKIEIYTKTPKKMVITKSTQQQNPEIIIADVSPKEKTIDSLKPHDKFINLLRNEIPDISENHLKQLILPIEAVRRSYFTSTELTDLKRQLHLIKELKRLKTVHASACTFSCELCSDINAMEAELSELQNCNAELFSAVKEPMMTHKENAFTATLTSSDVQTETVDFNQTFSNSSKPNETLVHMIGCKNNQDNDTEKEQGDENAILSINVDAEPYYRGGVFNLSTFQAQERARQWKRATHLQDLPRLLKTLTKEKSRTNCGSCSCDDGCRSVLTCECARQGVPCVKCRCCKCDHPMTAFLPLSVDISSARVDDCLMQTIFDFSMKQVQQLLWEDKIIPCCYGIMKLFQLIPNVIVCPNCKSFLSYSWCHREVRAENLYERNHCVVCCACQPPLHSHCYMCRKCTLSSVGGRCLECEETKIYSGVTLG